MRADHEVFEGRPANPRSGGKVLTTVASPISGQILRMHLKGPVDLSKPDGEDFVASQITPTGRATIVVADALGSWLARAPGGAIELGSDQAEEATHAFLAGWESSALWALGEQPLSLDELDGAIEGSGPAASLEDLLAAMKGAGLVAASGSLVGRGGGSFEVTEWARRGIAPLLAAMRCERRGMRDLAEPLTGPELEAALSIASPLARVHGDDSGACFFVVSAGRIKHKIASGLSGVHVELTDGVVSSCSSREEQDPATWVAGAIDAWLEALLGGRTGRLRFDGERPALARDLVEDLHESLFV